MDRRMDGHGAMVNVAPVIFIVSGCDVILTSR